MQHINMDILHATKGHGNALHINGQYKLDHEPSPFIKTWHLTEKKAFWLTPSIRKMKSCFTSSERCCSTSLLSSLSVAFRIILMVSINFPHESFDVSHFTWTSHLSTSSSEASMLPSCVVSEGEGSTWSYAVCFVFERNLWAGLISRIAFSVSLSCTDE